MGNISAHLACQVLIDHRGGYLYFGALTDPSTIYTAGEPAAARMQQLLEEDRWLGVWGNVLKNDANPPTIQHATLSNSSLTHPHTGATVELTSIGFTARKGIDPASF